MASHPATDTTPAPKLTRSDLVTDAALAVAVFGVSLALLAAGDTDLGEHAGEVGVLGVLLTALASLPLAAWRLAPLPVFVFVAVASAVLHGVVGPAGPPIGPTVALYQVATSGDGSGPRVRLTLAIVAGLFIAHLTVTGLAAGGFPGTESVLGALLWGAAWLAGDRARLRRERMAELEERALRAERDAERERRLAAAEERTRIARDLHDSAGQAINVILVQASAGRLQAERDPAGVRKAFETIEEVARETVGEIDQLVRVLRDDATPPEGRDRVEPPPGLAALEGLVARHRAAGLDVTAGVRGERRPLSAGVDRGAYRILQEALTNAARHGSGSASVQVAFGRSELEVTVVSPLRPGGAPRAAGGGHGIVGMRERAALLGGQLEAGPRNGDFRVLARLPLATRGE